LKKLGLSLTLISVFAVTALAGETPTGPCAPGETPTGPCSSAQQVPSEPVAPGETSTPPVSTKVEYSLTELGRDLIQDLLLLFYSVHPFRAFAMHEPPTVDTSRPQKDD